MIKYTDLHVHSEFSKEIPELDGYIATRDGRILDRHGTEKNTFTNSRGYIRVKLYIGGKYKNYSVHRLIAITFVPNINNSPQVNHKDGNKLNNNDWNLEWISVSNNIKHGIDNGLYTKQLDNQRKATITSSNIHSKAVEQLDKDGNVIDIFRNKHDASKSTGILPNNIKRCCVGKCNTAGGFGWRYKGGGVNV